MINKTNKWTKEEDLVLSNTSLSYDKVAILLPNRSELSIYSRAHKLGFSRNKDIIAKINSENQRKEEWTTPLLDVDFCNMIDGELLGDGCIYRKKVKNRNCYEYSFIGGSIHLDYANFVHNKIVSKLKSKSKIKIITPNMYQTGFRTSKNFYSYNISSVLFKSFYDRWYKEGSIKTNIPDDLTLTPITCLHWYMGDGSLDNRFKAKMFEIMLHTENFKFDTVEMLRNKLSKAIDIKVNVKKSKKYLALRIHGDHARKFLNYIGTCPVNNLDYKWIDWKSPERRQNWQTSLATLV